jgi:hypothetical protein
LVDKVLALKEIPRKGSQLSTMEGSMNVFNAAASIPGALVNTLLDGQQKQTELALKSIEIVAKQQLAIQQQETALFAIALMTGVGTKLDTVV